MARNNASPLTVFLTGIVFIFGGTFLLWWNEGNYVNTRAAIYEAESAAVELPSVEKIDGDFDGKLIHAFGKADTEDTITDEEFGVKAVALKMIRKSEYYQWIETVHERKDKYDNIMREYTYDRKWTSSPVNSSGFSEGGHENSVKKFVQNYKREAEKVSYGAYRLPPFLVDDIGGAKACPVNPTAEELKILNKRMDFQEPRVALHKSEDGYYIGKSPNAEQIGDVRISFQIIPPAEVSILAVAAADTFKVFTASNKKSVSRLEMGNVSLTDMIAHMHSETYNQLWILRALGFFGIIGGIMLMLNPITTLARKLPFVGEIAGAITGAGTAIISFLLGGAWALFVIAVAWFYVRPMIGILVLLAAFVCLWVLVRKLLIDARAKRENLEE